jgi:hypothetical protein
VDNTDWSWSTPKSAVVVLVIGALVLAVAGITTATDAPGRVVVGIAAVGLAFLAALGGLRRPRLALTESNGTPAIAVRTLWAVHTYTAADITRLRATDTRRFGRRNSMLEIDVDHHDDRRLLIFSRWDLGANPHDVHDAVAKHLR